MRVRTVRPRARRRGLGWRGTLPGPGRRHRKASGLRGHVHGHASGAARAPGGARRLRGAGGAEPECGSREGGFAELAVRVFRGAAGAAGAAVAGATSRVAVSTFC